MTFPAEIETIFFLAGLPRLRMCARRPWSTHATGTE
jgi:hypothetical protein